MNSKYKKLLAIYSKIPSIACKGLCHETCTIAPSAKIEIRRAKEAYAGVKLFSQSDVMNKMGNVLESEIPVCKMLKGGRCTIYRVRPAICRMYGVAKGLECMFGCVPDRCLSRDEANAIFEEIEEL